MIVGVFITLDSDSDSPLLKDGLNLKLDRCDDGEVIIQLQNWNEKDIFPPIEIDYEVLKKAIEKLEYVE